MDLEYADKRSLADDGYLLAGGVAGQRWSQALLAGRKSGYVIEIRKDHENSDEREGHQCGRDEPDSLPTPS